MKINITKRAQEERGNHVCEAEIIFEGDEPLAGLKLVGFSLWRRPDGTMYVTMPARAFGAGTERKYFNYLRYVPGHPEALSNIQEKILQAYERKGNS